MQGKGRFIHIGGLTVDIFHPSLSRMQKAKLLALWALMLPLNVMMGTFQLSRLGGGYALDIVTGRAAGPGLRTTYLALYTTAPNDASTMAAIAPGVETTMTGYARQSITWSAPTSATPPLTQNTNVITFGPLTGTMATVTSFAVVSTSSGATGDLVAFGNLTTARTPLSGDSLQAAAGSFQLTDE